MPGEHIAKAFTDKPDSQIVVLRPEFTLDHNPGWEWMLRRVAPGHRLGYRANDRVCRHHLAVGFVLFRLAVVASSRSLAGCAAGRIGCAALFDGSARAMPAIVDFRKVFSLPCCSSGRRTDPKNPSWLKVILTAAAFCLSTWMRRRLVFVGISFARHFFWRVSGTNSVFWLVCWVVGTFIAASPDRQPGSFS